MTDVMGIFLLLLSFKFLFARNSQIVNSLMGALIPIDNRNSASQLNYQNNASSQI